VVDALREIAVRQRLPEGASSARFYDFTAYECFVNSVHVEDYDQKNPLAQAIQFASRVLTIWNMSRPTLSLIAIISADEFSVVVKFHLKRLSQQWIGENVEGYKDSIMSMESSEDLLVELANSRK
jgi:hypothetical protein